MQREDLSFDSSGTRCAAWFYVPAPEGRHPAIIMAHGMGATRELGLDRFARRFCEAGFCVLAFDYRHYGASGGEPRELLSIARQRDDYRAAIDFVRGRSEVDPAQIVLWGSSFSGGHVIALAAEGLNLTAVIAQVPFTSGRAAARGLSLQRALGMNARALRDVFARALGKAPVYLPLLGSEADLALMAGEENERGYRRLVSAELEAAGRWHNRAAARVALSIPFAEPGAQLKNAKVPVLLIVAEDDKLTPAVYALRAAEGCPMVETRSFAGGHFDFYEGEGFELSIQAQLAFLHKHVARAPDSSVA